MFILKIWVFCKSTVFDLKKYWDMVDIVVKFFVICRARNTNVNVLMKNKSYKDKIMLLYIIVYL